MAVAEQADDDAAGGVLFLRLHLISLSACSRNEPTRGPRRAPAALSSTVIACHSSAQRALQLLLIEQDA
jgi:hypothetical protein